MRKANKFEAMQKHIRNWAYLKKLDKSIQQIAEGKVVIKTIDELEKISRMEN